MSKIRQNFRLDAAVVAAAKHRAWLERRTLTDVVESQLREYGAGDASNDTAREHDSGA